MVTFQTVSDNIIAGFITLLKAPYTVPEMIWIIVPLIITTLAMTLYFGKYRKEKLGWNTALGNSIVLLFVGIDLLRTLYHYDASPSFNQYLLHPIKTLIIAFIMIEGTVLAYVAFKHALPEKLVFFMTSPVSINLQAYVMIVIIYLRMIPTVYTLAATVLLFCALYIVLRTIQKIEYRILGYHKKGSKQ